VARPEEIEFFPNTVVEVKSCAQYTQFLWFWIHHLNCSCGSLAVCVPVALHIIFLLFGLHSVFWFFSCALCSSQKSYL